MRTKIPEQNGRSAVLWNAVFSVISAVQSVLILAAVSRIYGSADAGIISLAFSYAYLMIIIGNYGVKNFQVTDIAVRYSFRDYAVHRATTCLIMAGASLLCVAVRGYDLFKGGVILLCCLLKLTESVENLFYGEYQRAGRLDTAGKIGTARLVISMAALLICMLLTKDLILSLIVMNAVGILLLAVFVIRTYPTIPIARGTDKGRNHWRGIYVSCFPLFLSGFFNIFISNASKYALDIYSTDTVQGYYGMIYSPVFAIGLISSCIYAPALVRLAGYWNTRKTEEILKFVARQFITILSISAVIILGCWLIGIPGLSLFYGTDLSGVKTAFMILLIGGVMTAIINFMNDLITVMRKQPVLIWIFGGTFLAAIPVTAILVKGYGIEGAAIAYALLTTLQAAAMTIFVIRQLKKSKAS